jgi:multidrug transporter EmrE-like cation transporter
MALEVPPPEALPVSAPSRPSGWVISLALLVVSVGFAIAGQLTLKAAMDSVGRIGSKEVSNAGSTIARAAKEPKLWIGLVLFGISAIFWLVVLSRVPLSVAYPIVGISYVLIVLFARVFLGEHVPLSRWIGVLVVALGIAIVGISFRRVPT